MDCFADFMVVGLFALDPGAMARARVRAYNEGLGLLLSGCPGAEPLVRELGGGAT